MQGETEGNRALLKAALNSLATDTGLHPLLPYFMHFVTESVTKSLKQTALLQSLMRGVNALLIN